MAALEILRAAGRQVAILLAIIAAASLLYCGLFLLWHGRLPDLY
jgi:hypothetical protein